MDLDRLAEQAEQVTTQTSERERTFADENHAAAVLVEAIIAKVRPSLRSIASRVQTEMRISNLADPNGQKGGESYADWRGICLNSDKPGPERDCPNHNSGKYEGIDLFLRADGTLVELEYDGTWSKWQGSSWGWTATENEIGIDDAVDAWSEAHPEQLVEKLSRLLEQQLEGNTQKRMAASRARAEKLRAMAALLK